jgi:hypothetical protein
MTLERKVSFVPGYIHRENGKLSSKHGMDIVFLLTGPEGAISFTIFTCWYPDGEFTEPTGAEVVWHSRIPLWEGQSHVEQCKYLNDEPCYSDGSSTLAQVWFIDFLHKGEAIIWPKMEQIYKEKLIKNENTIPG